MEPVGCSTCCDPLHLDFTVARPKSPIFTVRPSWRNISKQLLRKFYRKLEWTNLNFLTWLQRLWVRVIRNPNQLSRNIAEFGFLFCLSYLLQVLSWRKSNFMASICTELKKKLGMQSIYLYWMFLLKFKLRFLALFMPVIWGCFVFIKNIWDTV